ncbi:DUF4129 domain-containing protein [Marininema halotolerans]|uniref:Protein-glutamine gamma-glutamyltransferase-like C-terminal domain-containing protein n=1 Tax=Marininema halotolerans TaxID=1155944 RepID=A0A1I6R866_9BACL|nr:DUF4129 domain-containing protein [Marininema halotolerans]SFS60892.1 protein of unknown function [Marininema halotolerans]
MAPEYDKARDQLSEILDRSEFTNQQWLDQWQTFFNNILDILSSFLAKQLHSWLGIQVDTRIGGVLPILVGVIVLVLGIWLARRFFWSKPRVNKDTHKRNDRTLSLEDWWKKAEDYGNRGAYREGITLLYQAVLEQLIQQGIIIGNRYKSNRDYRDEVEQNRPDLAIAFKHLTHRFDRVRYGDGDADKKEYTEFYQLSQRFAQEGDMR